MAAMERDEVLQLVRDHLSTELEVSPEQIQPETRFREDLDADSLDLYGSSWSSRTVTGIRVSEEEAAEIKTVGDAVDLSAPVYTRGCSGGRAKEQLVR